MYECVGPKDIREQDGGGEGDRARASAHARGEPGRRPAQGAEDRAFCCDALAPSCWLPPDLPTTPKIRMANAGDQGARTVVATVQAAALLGAVKNHCWVAVKAWTQLVSAVRANMAACVGPVPAHALPSVVTWCQMGPSGTATLNPVKKGAGVAKVENDVVAPTKGKSKWSSEVEAVPVDEPVDAPNSHFAASSHASRQDRLWQRVQKILPLADRVTGTSFLAGRCMLLDDDKAVELSVLFFLSGRWKRGRDRKQTQLLDPGAAATPSRVFPVHIEKDNASRAAAQGRSRAKSASGQNHKVCRLTWLVQQQVLCQLPL